MAPRTIALDESSYSIDDSCNDSVVPKATAAQEVAAAESENAGADSKLRDPFLYYSNDAIRMATLKCQDATAAIANVEFSQQRERKTRLSFELDPLLIMMDVMDKVSEDCDNALDQSDYVEELDRSDDPGTNLFADLLRI